MKQDITKYVAECDTCERVKADHMHTQGYLQPLPISVWKWKDISMDFIVSLPHTSKGYNSIWVIVDRLTKSAHYIPVDARYLAKSMPSCIFTRL